MALQAHLGMLMTPLDEPDAWGTAFYIGLYPYISGTGHACFCHLYPTINFVLNIRMLILYFPQSVVDYLNLEL